MQISRATNDALSAGDAFLSHFRVLEILIAAFIGFLSNAQTK
jgi:hypothetical protein